jgi:putative hydrolase of the HAD superfamily
MFACGPDGKAPAGAERCGGDPGDAVRSRRGAGRRGAGAAGAFAATAAVAATTNAGVDGARLALDARSRARQLWRSSPTLPYCLRTGISSWEGVWCRFEGDGPETAALREWAPVYRREAWRLALPDQGIDDADVAAELGERFARERGRRHETFADAEATMAELGARHRLALVTNGAACLQREKLEASGLGRHFDAVVVSAEIGVGKPEPEIFAAALDRLGAAPDEAAMVDDTIDRDVAGASAAGLAAIWLNRVGQPVPSGAPPPVETAGSPTCPPRSSASSARS